MPIPWFRCLSLALGLGAMACASAAPTGYRGDGSGVFADATPPTGWDSATGRNVRWACALPNWGHGSPVVVGTRAFVMCEAIDGAPLLVCVDTTTGTVAWQREVDHFALLPEGKRTRATALRRDELRQNRRAYAAFFDFMAAPDDAARQTVRTRAQADGIGLPDIPPALDSATRTMEVLGPCQPFARRETYQELKEQYGFFYDTWRYWGLWIGSAFATPASDGTHVYVTTGMNVVACYDLEGQQVWLRYLGKPTTRMYYSALCVSSPVVVGDALIVHMGKWLRALNLADGTSRWGYETKDQVYYMAGTPVHLRLGDIDVVVTCNGDVVRVPDGKVLASSLGFMASGASPAVNDDTLYIINGQSSTTYPGERMRGVKRGLMAVRLALTAPDVVTPTVLWTCPRFGGQGDASRGDVSPVYANGYVYAQDHQTICVLKADTGEVVREVAVKHPSGHALTIAGGHLYTLSEQGGSSVLALGPDAAVVAEGQLASAPVEGDKRAQIIGECGSDRWPVVTRGTPSAAGDALFVRGEDYLYCVGERR